MVNKLVCNSHHPRMLVMARYNVHNRDHSNGKLVLVRLGRQSVQEVRLFMLAIVRLSILQLC